LTGSTGCGALGCNQISRVYHNDGGGAFSQDTAVTLPAVQRSGVAWGDYDNDGRLDFLLTGSTNGSASGGISKLYHNGEAAANTAPAAPGGLSATGLTTSTATLAWTAAADAQTAAAGLSYNLRVGTTPGGSEVVGPQADAA